MSRFRSAIACGIALCAPVPVLVQEAGAAFIGGCCGTTPKFIRAVAEQTTGRDCS